MKKRFGVIGRWLLPVLVVLLGLYVSLLRGGIAETEAWMPDFIADPVVPVPTQPTPPTPGFDPTNPGAAGVENGGYGSGSRSSSSSDSGSFGNDGLTESGSTTPTPQRPGTTPVEVGEPGDLAATILGVDNLAAGDTVIRYLDLSNTGGYEFTNFTLSLAKGAGDARLLGPFGVRVSILTCTTEWDEYGECAGDRSVIVSSRSVSALALDPIEIRDPAVNAPGAPGETTSYQVRLTLPGWAGNDYQGLRNSVVFTFAAA